VSVSQYYSITLVFNLNIQFLDFLFTELSHLQDFAPDHQRILLLCRGRGGAERDAVVSWLDAVFVLCRKLIAEDVPLFTALNSDFFPGSFQREP
jgi:hypothetical protein